MRPPSLLLAALALLVFSACDVGGPEPLPESDSYTGFDAGLNGWEAQATDLELAGDSIEWHLEYAPDRGAREDGSMEIYIDNNNDAGKVWGQKTLTGLEPHTTYEVDVHYVLGTSVYSSVNAWRIIAGVHSTPPQTSGDLTYHGDTSHDSGEGTGYVWVDKSYSFTVETDQDGRLYVAIGIWGTWENPRTYFIDDIRIDYEAHYEAH